MLHENPLIDPALSAICGVFNLNGAPVAPEVIASMTDALAHRGQDGRGVWFGGKGAVAVGHRALHTTPESRREPQPIVREQSGLTLVADARIGNREELIGTLGLSRAVTPTDGELVLSAYEKWGEGCADRLIGDFAFAIWDERAHRLFCARDPMGVKPFYYYCRTAQQFVFASEAKALFQAPGVDDTIDPEQVALFLGWHHDDRERTLYRNVLRLPAAHTLIVSRGRTLMNRYWSADRSRDVRFRRVTEYADAFREHFGNAVSERLRSDRAVGATLSGGLDSSSIVCMARQLRGAAAAPLHTFSVIFPSLAESELRLIDERPFVDTVVRSGGLDPHFVLGDERSPLSDVERIVWHLDEPYSMPNLYLHWAMFDAASEAGARVILDGFDGDSAVSHGFGYLTALARARDYETLTNEVRAFSTLHGKSPDLALDAYVLPLLSDLARQGRFLSWWHSVSRIRERFPRSLRNLALHHGLAAVLPNFVRELYDRRAPMAPEHSFISEELSRTLRLHELQSRRPERRRCAQSEREAHVEGISQPAYQLTLEVADKCAAAFGIEPRYPFFDRRLIEFCVGLPEEQKFGGGWPRLLFRRAMEGILPREIQWRTTKANLSPNFHRRFREVDAKRIGVEGSKACVPFVRPDCVAAARKAYLSAPAGRMRLEALALFRVGSLEAWLGRGTEGPKTESRDVCALSPAAA